MIVGAKFQLKLKILIFGLSLAKKGVSCRKRKRSEGHHSFRNIEIILQSFTKYLIETGIFM